MTTSSTDQFAAAVAAELRAERARLKLTIAHVVDGSGLSKSAVLHYLNGQRDIPIPALAAICRALGVSPVVIFERAEQSIEN